MIWDYIILCLLAFIQFLPTNRIWELGSLTGPQLAGMLIYIFCFPILIILGLFIFKTYKILTKNIGFIDVLKIAAIVLAINIVGLLLLLFLPRKVFPDVSVVSWALSTLTSCLIIPSIRTFYRIQKVFESHAELKTIPTIVIGAGSAGSIAIEDARNNTSFNNLVVAVVDDDPDKIGSLLFGIPVEGPIENLPQIIEAYQAKEVIIAIADLTKERLKEILDILNKCSVRIRRMPILSEMAGPNDTKITDVNLDELLGREPIALDNHKIRSMLRGQTVLVTGAGGSIGSELVRQIFSTHPKTLILFDIYENSTYEIQMELVRKMRDENIDDVGLITLIGSTYNMTRMEQVIKKYKPDYIYHAAAYKHVPLMEDSPVEAIRTNVLGTYNVAKLADKYKVKKMVLVSTDKAVRPTNVMGATKRFAETIIQYFAEKSNVTAYAAVRFGNVLGSNGSVVPLFKKQIEAGGPITITHKEIIRYFMTIPEAVSLILQCGLFATGGEIFILDMGKPVKIYDLAERMIRQTGLVPGEDIQIVETGLRPGEKLFEELLLDESMQQKTANKRIFVEKKEKVYPIEDELSMISEAFEMSNNRDIKKLLSKIITTYRITENR